MRSDLSIGLDVSLDQTSVCVVDESGGTVWRGRCKSTPDDIAATVQRHAPDVARVGLECGQLSTWLFHELKARGLPVVCIDARLSPGFEVGAGGSEISKGRLTLDKLEVHQATARPDPSPGSYWRR